MIVLANSEPAELIGKFLSGLKTCHVQNVRLVLLRSCITNREIK